MWRIVQLKTRHNLMTRTIMMRWCLQSDPINSIVWRLKICRELENLMMWTMSDIPTDFVVLWLKLSDRRSVALFLSVGLNFAKPITMFFYWTKFGKKYYYVLYSTKCSKILLYFCAGLNLAKFIYLCFYWTKWAKYIFLFLVKYFLAYIL